MGKASSAKKIARAARAGGRASGVRQRNLLFPGIIGAVVLLGVGLVAVAWSDHREDAEKIHPTIDDHWHSAYGIYVCDDFLPTTPAVENESPIGIHTHGDGVVHIHPFAQAGAGENATLGAFLENTEIEVSDDELKVGEQTWKEGDAKCGDEDGEVVVARWKDIQNTDERPSIVKAGFNDLRFRTDGEGYTIAFVAEGNNDIPKPPSAADLAALGAVDNPNATTTTAPGTESTVPGETTVPGQTTLPGETTVPPDPNTTVPPGSDTTATTAAGG